MPTQAGIALQTDAAPLGLRRLVVPTSVGNLVVHAGRESPSGDKSSALTILLHGAAGSWTTWTPLLAASDRLKTRLTDVVAIDLPGFGDSDGIGRVRDVEQMSRAIAEVARALGYSQWTLVGHSLGGFIALDVAARFPDETRAVTLISASGAGVVDAIRRPLRGGTGLPGFAGMLTVMRVLAALGPAGRALVHLADRLGLVRALTSPLFAGPVDDSVIDAFADEVRPSAFTQAAHLAGEYEMRTWTAIACPVRSVRGVDDVFAGERDAAVFSTLIADFSEMRLPNVGHFANIERPDAVLKAMGF
ncbi:alpha/beta fold hydrolase (plasmid) [Coraliomargarita sp. W4R53]